MELKLNSKREAVVLKPSQKRKNISMPEKMVVFRKYFSEFGNKIKGDTIYEGLPLGRMLIEIRRNIKSRRQSYSEADISELIDMGFLGEGKHYSAIEEKISLIKRYIDEVGEEITGDTVFDGKLIGRMVIELRSFIRNEKHIYSEKYINELRELGVLEPKLGKLQDKVFRLEEFCTLNLKIWRNRNKIFLDYENGIISPLLSESNITIEQLKQLDNDYEYIRGRKTRGKLSSEDIEKLTDAGVGGTFGYPRELLELSQKTGIDIKVLDEIMQEFSSIDVFRKLYVDFMVDYDNYYVAGEKNTPYIAGTFGSVERFDTFIKFYNYLAKNKQIITCFDLEEPGFIANYKSVQLAHIIEKKHVPGYFFDKNEYKASHAKLKRDQQFVLEELSNADANGMNETELGKKLCLTRSRVGQIKKLAARKVKPALDNISLNNIANRDKRAEFIRKYFAEKDIFISAESFEISEGLKSDLIQINEHAKNSASEEVVNTIANRTSQSKKRKAKTVEEYSLREVDFSSRVCEALENIECYTIGDIIDKIKIPYDLINIPGCGTDSVAEIVSKIHQLGLHFEFESNSKEENEKDKCLTTLIQMLQNAYKRLDEVVVRCETAREKITKEMEVVQQRISEAERRMEESKQVITKIKKHKNPKEVQRIVGVRVEYDSDKLVVRTCNRSLAELKKRLEAASNKGNAKKAKRDGIKSFMDSLDR